MKLSLRTGVLACALGGAVFGQVTFNGTPSREIGQPRLTPIGGGAPNWVEGRELNAPQGVAVDTSANPPIVYVADTSNNRVLAWKNSAGVSKGDFADLAIGQPDKFTTTSGGPSNQLNQQGLNAPTGLAVDKSGNLYVADTGNNRIVRYPKPFGQAAGFAPTIDLVIGQSGTTSGNSANQGLQTPNAKTLAFTQYGSLYLIALAVDGSGNLWVTDAGNSRVLRYPAAVLTPNNSLPAADLVIGQIDFATVAAVQAVQIPNNTSVPPNQQYNKGTLAQPSGIAFDQNGRLYVTDVYNRVLFYNPPFLSGMQATRVLGVVLPKQGTPYPTINDTLLGTGLLTGRLQPPDGVVTVGNNLFVFDTPNNRIVKYDVPESWPAESTTYSPPGKAFTGQPDSVSGKANHGLKEPANDSLNVPVTGAYSGSELWVADTGNHRVIAFPLNGGNFTVATRLIGQVDYQYNAPNLIEGKELYISSGFTSSNVLVGGGGMVVDKRSNPPHLFIADTLNNRVIGFRDSRSVKAGVTADLVIGQPDVFRAQVNYPNNDSTLPNEGGLSAPTTVALDANGDLWVADSGNSRVLRFPQPFAQPSLFGQKANLVLGQANLTSKVTDPSSRSMRFPTGIAFISDGSVLVSDAAFNRVLLFRKPSGADFSNGQAAVLAIGEPDFTTINGGDSTTYNRFNSPHGIATDTDDRLYVCDTANNRVHIYRQQTLALETDPSPVLTLPNIYNPHSIAVSTVNGDIWVASAYTNQVIRFPLFLNLVVNPVSNFTLPANFPISVAFDAFDNVLVGEAINRISMYYPGLATANAASYSGRPLAPGMIATLAPLGTQFPTTPTAFSSLPVPTTLGDIQVTINGVPAPLFFAGPTQINFQVPINTPTNAPADFQVTKVSTGQLVAVGSITMARSSPAFFTGNQQGTGQISALNDDNTVNTPTNPVTRGKYIQMFGTGQGFVPGAPNDGDAPTGAVPATGVPINVLVNGPSFLDPSQILYFGLAPGLVGVWQLNVKIADTVPPSATIPVVITVNDIASNQGPGGTRIVTTIAVK